MVQKKVVFITGAAQGIGYEIGKRFAANGAAIVLTDIQEEPVRRAAEKLQNEGFTAIGLKCDAAYNSAKHGVIGLTKVAALETAEHGITVNALCPGYIDTPLVRNQLSDLAATRNVPIDKALEEVIFPLVPQKRLLTVEEVADYAIFLSGESARGVTGQAIVIDGGYTVQ